MALLPVTALLCCAAACHPTSPPPPPPPPEASAEDRFGTLEHDYAIYMMSRFPVVATYLGGSAFDPSLAHIDGKLRDYSEEALKTEDARLSDFRDGFTALDAGKLSARRRTGPRGLGLVIGATRLAPAAPNRKRLLGPGRGRRGHVDRQAGLQLRARVER